MALVECAYAVLMMFVALPLAYYKLGSLRGCQAEQTALQVAKCALEQAPWPAEHLWLAGYLLLCTLHCITCCLGGMHVYKRWKTWFGFCYRFMPPATALVAHALGAPGVEQSCFLILGPYDTAPLAHISNALLFPVRMFMMSSFMLVFSGPGGGRDA